MTYPYGIVEDVLVKVDKFIFPADFVVLDMEEDAKVPIILGRPFLATGRALIDVEQGQLMLRVADEKVTFSMTEAVKHKLDREDCFKAEIIESLVLEEINFHVKQNPLERTLLSGMEAKELKREINDEEVVKCAHQLEVLKPIFNSTRGIEDLHKSEDGGVETSKVELKQLFSHLKYRFLDEQKRNPVIVSNELSYSEEDKLLRVLREYKSALGWKIDDLQGISPTVCMHKIYLEEDFKPVRQPQRRLNPTMKEVVRKEVIKLLDAGIIYPISDSEWVSPIHVVPKKGGMTMVINEANELIPTRKVTGWRMCIDYQSLNQATRKDHFPLPFIDQMVEKLAGHAYYCFLDGYSGYNQIAVAPEDQEKTAFTCPYSVFAYRRMPFGLCNAPATFQRCMFSIFSDLVENCIEIFMDDYEKITMEFLSSVKAEILQGKDCEEGLIEFRLHNSTYRLTLVEFNAIFGFPT
ncbi:uncharacterized protein LOC128197551 [Vigna angularis]|uniref:uncharacterized protein LOC128197551 n=1 Tax=Phaseolus angularis TaxID=3914 RepID=UPI0022B5AD87|nr:uncharacterized protein LOC128197551 [Vigna angularis]